MKLKVNDDSFTIWLSKMDTSDWAIRPRAAWPGSELAGRRLCATFDTNGLLDYTVDGRAPSDRLHIPADEFSAVIADHLKGKLPKSHPCYFVACGQFL